DLIDDKNKLRMKWFGDDPKLDIVTADRKAKSKRRLIDVGWKRMRSATSLHAEFHDHTVESIVVISGCSLSEPIINHEQREPLNDFALAITNQTGTNRVMVTT